MLPTSERRSISGKNIRQPLASLAPLALAFLFSTPACKAAATQPAALQTIQLTFKEGQKPVTLEVADTEDKWKLGLMNRASMPADHGMLFVFDKTDTWGFWMKDTLIPLDLVFLDEAGKIVGIFPLKPHDETTVAPDKPVRFAIELNAGTAKSLGLKIGDSVPLPHNLLKPARTSDDK